MRNIQISRTDQTQGGSFNTFASIDFDPHARKSNKIQWHYAKVLCPDFKRKIILCKLDDKIEYLVYYFEMTNNVFFSPSHFYTL